MTHDKDIPPEEREKWSLDRERDADALNDYVKIEKVIGMQENEDGETEYYVKCMTDRHFPEHQVADTFQGRDSIMIRARGKQATLSATSLKLK